MNITPHKRTTSMKHQLLALLTIIACTLNAAAYDFKVNGLCYNFNSDGISVSVTKPYAAIISYGQELPAKLAIPSIVTYSFKRYIVTGIDDYAFVLCKSLTSVKIPNYVTSIGKEAFRGCSALTSVSIPNSVTTIGDEAFSGCGLTNVTIPNSVSSIADGVFRDCSGLTSVSIPNSVTSIGSSAFSGCSGMTSITIGTSVSSFGLALFEGCTGLMSVTWNAKSCQDFNTGFVHDIPFEGLSNIKTFTFGDEVEKIPDYLCYGLSGLTSVSIPNSVTEIGESAFEDCTGLTSVTFGNSLTAIDVNAFDGTAWFNNQPDGLVYAGPVAYKYKGTMPSGTNLVIQNGSKGIAQSCFSDCIGLNSITIPNTVTAIGNFAFSDCNNLKRVHISDINAWCNIKFELYKSDFVGIVASNPLEYAHHLYLNDKEIKKLEIPNSVTAINDYAFYECSGLTSVTIPNSVTSIGTGAFSFCTGLTSLSIPNSVESIGSAAFYETPWLNNKSDGLVYAGLVAYEYKGTMPSGTKIVIKQGTKGIAGHCFWDCKGLTGITIPNSVTEIGVSAFEYCKGLTGITTPNSVTEIGVSAFEYCDGLTSVTIPAFLKFIRKRAFTYCSNLKSVHIPISPLGVTLRLNLLNGISMNNMD